VSRYGHLILYAVILAAAYGLARPGSRAGKAVTSVTESFSGVLNQGLSAVGG
jgi:hypothetical protein